MKEIVLHLRHYLADEPFVEDVIAHIEDFEPVTLCQDWMSHPSTPRPYQVYLLGEAPPPWRWGWMVSSTWIGSTGHLPYRRTLAYARVRALHAHFGPTGIWALPLSRRLDVPLITSFYGYDVSQHTRRLLWRLLYRVLFRQGDCFLALGPMMRRRLIALGCPAEKIRVHHLGVDLSQIPFVERRPPTDGQTLYVLMVGRLVEKKGFSYGIAAFAQIAARFPQAELRIIGDGPLRDELAVLIEEEKLQARISLVGRVPRARVFQEMQRAHLLLAPSVTARNGDQEGTPTVLLEAQASGLPVVATRHADIPSTVVEGQSGYLVPERDVDALAKRMADTLGSPGTWSAMGCAGRQHIAANFDIHHLSRSLEAVYQSVLKS